MPFITKKDPPAIAVNDNVDARFREQQKKYYYDPTKCQTYLKQLGFASPTVRGARQETSGQN